MWRRSSTTCGIVAEREDWRRSVVVWYSIGAEVSDTIEMQGVEKRSSRRSTSASRVVAISSGWCTERRVGWMFVQEGKKY